MWLETTKKEELLKNQKMKSSAVDSKRKTQKNMSITTRRFVCCWPTSSASLSLKDVLFLKFKGFCWCKSRKEQKKITESSLSPDSVYLFDVLFLLDAELPRDGAACLPLFFMLVLTLLRIWNLRSYLKISFPTSELLHHHLIQSYLLLRIIHWILICKVHQSSRAFEEDTQSTNPDEKLIK